MNISCTNKRMKSKLQLIKNYIDEILSNLISITGFRYEICCKGNLSLLQAKDIYDQACENRHVSTKKSPIFTVFAVSYLNNYYIYCNKTFITTAAFNGLFSAAYGNGIAHSE